MQQIVDVYDKHAELIFSKNILGDFLVCSKYTSKNITEIFNNIFSELTLNDTKTQLIIPATCLSNGGPKIYKSTNSHSLVKSKLKLVEVITASCAAPTLFDPQIVHSELVADGGMWANNPSMIAWLHATNKLKIAPQQIRLLSIGNGFVKKCYDHEKLKESPMGWGFMTKWSSSKLIEFALNLQSTYTHECVNTLAPEGNYLRINFKSKDEIPADDLGSRPLLKEQALLCFEKYANKLKHFLELSTK